MIKGKGEIRDINRQSGRGILHKDEFQECSKNCQEPGHCIIFTRKHLVEGNVNAYVGTKVFYTAFPKGEDVEAFTRTLRQAYIGR